MQEDTESRWIGTCMPIAPPTLLHRNRVACDISYLTCARILDAVESGRDWRQAAVEILGCDVDKDPQTARELWQAHLEHARSVVARGLLG